MSSHFNIFLNALKSYGDLDASDFHAVPDSPAAYVVYRPALEDPIFRAVNPGEVGAQLRDRLHR